MYSIVFNVRRPYLPIPTRRSLYTHTQTKPPTQPHPHKQQVKDHPIEFGDAALNKRLVYSPHQYGPSVTGDAHFAGGTYMGFPGTWPGSCILTEEWPQSIMIQAIRAMSTVIGYCCRGLSD